MKIPALLLEWPAALFGHVFLVLAIWVVNMFSGPPKPLFKPDDVMEISMSGPPKSTSNMAQKAERAPDPVKGSDALQPPPPPNQSDMAFHTPDAPPNKGQKDADIARQKIMDDLKRAEMLKDLSAPIGTQNRQASDPNGSGDGSTASSGINDPEMAKWIKKVDDKVRPNWHPLVAVCQANPKMKIGILVSLTGAGVVTDDPTVGKSSGNTSLDQSALRAVQQTGTLPALPAKYSGGITATIMFDCANAI